MSEDQALTCNFCGKKRDDVEKLIAGPGVYICDECVKLSYGIVSEEQGGELGNLDFDELPRPSDIKDFLPCSFKLRPFHIQDKNGFL